MPRNRPTRPRTPLEEKKQRILLAFDRFTPPAVGVQDTPNRCYRLNNRWAKIIMGFVSLLTETRGWDGAIYDDHPGIIGVSQFLVGEECGLIDCNEVETCLTTSIIINAINISLYSFSFNSTQAHLDDLTAAYDGTAQSIGPSIPTTAPELDSFHNNALCAVIGYSIGAYAATKAAGISLKNGLTVSWQEAVNFMGRIFPILPDWLLYLLGDELYGCVADFGEALTVLTSNTAKAELACCLYDELRGVVMTEAVWNAAIATCASTLTGNAGDLACLFDGDNNQPHYLSFLEQYNNVLERQTAGDDFACLCAPDGWFWVDVDFLWKTPVHSGNLTSPLITVTNPVNGELFSMTYRYQAFAPGDIRATPKGSGLSDTWLTSTPLFRGGNLWMCENEFAGVAEGRDAVGWPSGDFFDINTNNAMEQPGITWTLEFKDGVSLGHTAFGVLSNVRLLYKEVP